MTQFKYQIGKAFLDWLVQLPVCAAICRRWCVASLCAALLNGCASQAHETTAIETEMNQLAKNKVAPVVPAAVQDAIVNGPANQPRGENRFDVAVNNIPARSFFIGLAADSGVNVVTDPNLEGAISLQLKNVTLDEVLNVTRDMFGYEYRKSEGIYTIYAKQMRTEIFPINYIDVQRKGTTDTQVITGSGNGSKSATPSNSNGANGSDSQSGGNSGGNSGGDAEKSQTSGSNSGARVITTNSTDFWRNLQETLLSILGDQGDGRSVTVNPQSGLVIVKALPKDLNAVRNFLEKSELSVKRQVVLETKILEVRLSNGFQSGVNWETISGKLAYGFNIGDGFGLDGGQSQVNKWRKLGDHSMDYTDTNGVKHTLSNDYREPTGGTFASMLQVNDISKLISLLETQGDVQVLSSPRVSTVNNQKAVIRVGSDEFFVTGVTNNTTSSAAATTSSPNIELASFFSGISMDVTPQIAENGDVILHVHPMVSDVKDQQKTFTVGSQDFSLPLALRDIRESDSVVRAKSGQVVVLGGLMQQVSNKLDGKRPLLGDIPVLNTLFKTKSSVGTKTELVILMRPIVVDEKTWQDQLDQNAEQFKTLGDEIRKR